MLMKSLTEHQYFNEAELQLRNIFLNDNPRKIRLGCLASHRLLIYEYWPPDSVLLNSIIDAATEIGEDSFYFSNLVRNKTGGVDEPNHWLIPFKDKSVYLSENTDIFNCAYQMENAIYSTQGSWGVISSFEKFGILAGSQKVIKKVQESIPSINSQVNNFLNYIKKYKNAHPDILSMDTSWVFDLMVEIYGREAAIRMYESI
jgi:hypothetical protein